MKKRIVSLALVLMLMLTIAPIARADNVKLIALTFDDGPNPTYTARLLDGLKERGVKATFFILGQMAEYYPDLVVRAAQEGHQIGNHSYSHQIFTMVKSDVVTKELERCETVLDNLLGEGDHMVRVPGGNFSDRVTALVQEPIILWTIDPTNGIYSPPATAAKLQERIVARACDNAIILMHDNTGSNLTAAFGAIDTLRAQGYEFVTVEELFRLNSVGANDGQVYWSVPELESGFNEQWLEFHWAAEYINYVKNAGLMEGDAGAFLPNSGMSRAMAATVFWRLAGKPSSGAASTFADVPADSWYAGAVAWGKSAGLIEGYSDTVFAPNDLVTREQVYVMAARWMSRQGITGARLQSWVSYSDDYRNTDAWAWESVQAVRRAGFESVNDRQLFRGRDTMTRAEAAELIAWLDKLS